jgi:hypothetical protein
MILVGNILQTIYSMLICLAAEETLHQPTRRKSLGDIFGTLGHKMSLRRHRLHHDHDPLEEAYKDEYRQMLMDTEERERNGNTYRGRQTGTGTPIPQQPFRTTDSMNRITSLVEQMVDRKFLWPSLSVANTRKAFQRLMRFLKHQNAHPPHS